MNALQKPKITVLIAVYNAEKTLKKCLDSLLTQTLSEWQAICIDDASTDSSLSILNDYAKDDARFRIMSLKENRGQAHARNQGLLMAEGDFTCFLDSDDWFSEDALQSVVATFMAYPKTDCVLFDCQMVNEKTHELTPYEMSPFDVKSGREAFIDSLSWKIHGVYAVRTSLHLQHPYDESAHGYSDDNTTRIHYYFSREVRSCKGRYYYLQRHDSVTHIKGISRLDYLLATDSMKNMLIELNCDVDTIRLYEHQRWLCLIDTYMHYYNERLLLSARERQEYLRVIRDHWNMMTGSDEDKFGYRHCTTWKKFRCQEEMYFLLRKIKKIVC